VSCFPPSIRARSMSTDLRKVRLLLQETRSAPRTWHVQRHKCPMLHLLERRAAEKPANSVSAPPSDVASEQQLPVSMACIVLSQQGFNSDVTAGIREPRHTHLNAYAASTDGC
jgi:hypothetical protein